MRIVLRTDPAAHDAVLATLGEPAKWGQHNERLTPDEVSDLHEERIKRKAEEFHNSPPPPGDHRPIRRVSFYDVVDMSRTQGVPVDRNVLVYDYEVPAEEADAFEAKAAALPGFLGTRRI